MVNSTGCLRAQTQWYGWGCLAVTVLAIAWCAQITLAVDDPAIAEAAVAEHPYPGHVPSPSLDGGKDWLNTAGPLDLKDLRGKFVLLDFWTYCCINCIHILPELKKLEKQFPNELVVIGVHSGKFDAEHDAQNIRDAILRYEIEHPVVNDPEHIIWNKFLVTSWPSLRLIDPQGNLVGGHSGEIGFEALKAVLDRALPYYRAHGLIDETPLHFDLEHMSADTTPLRYPGKLLADEKSDRLFISDSNHNRIVVATLAGQLVEVIGTGQIGAEDGPIETATFDHPQGMALRGNLLYVADTENHLLRKVDLQQRTVTTIAGTGRQAHVFPGVKRDDESIPRRFAGKPLETALNSPWDLLIHKNDLFIAMAGPHQIWRMSLDESEIALHAGSGREDIIDGPMLPKQPYQEGIAALAQPSGLATDGNLLYVADSEGSSIRSLPFTPAGKVLTVVGTAHLPFNRLFTFGDVDGRAADARLQHPLGLAMQRDQLYVADTYNNKIKRIDIKRKTVETIAGTGKRGASDQPPSFNEPAGLTIAAGRLYVADTNNHLIRVVHLDEDYRVSTLAIAGLEPPAPREEQISAQFAQAEAIELSPMTVRPVDGAVRFAVSIDMPAGYKVNELAPISYQIECVKGAAFVDPSVLGMPRRLEKPASRFELAVPVTNTSGGASLKVSLNYFYCQDGGQGLCKMRSISWLVPLRLSESSKQAVVPLAAAAE